MAMDLSNEERWVSERRRWAKPWYDGNAGDEELASGHGSSVDKVLYQNIVEMIPLLESFMNQQKRFPRRACLVYTPTPSHSFSNKGANNPDNKEQAEEVRNGFMSLGNDSIKDTTISQLQNRIDSVEKQLEEKEMQLQSTGASFSQDLLQLQMKLEELHTEIQDKDQKIKVGCAELAEKQEKILQLNHLLEKAESNLVESSRKAAEIEDELNSLRCQVAALILIESSHGNIAEEDSRQTVAVPKNVGGQMNDKEHDENGTSDDNRPIHIHKLEAPHMQSIQRKYLAAIIAARESPNEEMLLLVNEFRMQLQFLLMQPPFDCATDDLFTSRFCAPENRFFSLVGKVCF